MKKYYLFGYGLYGRSLCDFIGKDKILGFIDNDLKKCGYDEYIELEVIHSSVFFEKYNGEYVIIAVSEQYENTIENQLMENHIYSYIKLSRLSKLLDNASEEIGGNLYEKELIEQLKERCDQTTSIEFYLVDSFEIFHYLPIYNQLLKKGINAKIIAEPCFINSSGVWFDYFKAVDILNKLGIKFGKLRNPNAKVSITTQYYENLNRYKNRKVQMSYGPAMLKSKAFQMMYDVVKNFDALLVHGEFQKDHLVKIGYRGTIVRMSYPKLGSNVVKSQSTEMIKIDDTKPVLLYLPTWDEYSSIEEYSKVLGQLREHYNVLTKPHHCTEKLEEKKQEMELLYDNCDYVFESNYNILEIINDIDVLICDGKSAVAYEMLFLNPKVDLYLILNNGLSVEDYYLNIKKIGTIIKNSEELLNYLTNSEKKNHERRQEIINYMIDEDIDRGVQNVVVALEDMLMSEKKQS